MPQLINGSTNLTLGDHLNWFIASGACLKSGIVAGAMLGAFMLILEHFLGEGITAMELGTAGVVIIFVPVLTVVLALVINVFWFMKLSASQRDMTWKISSEEILLYDASGNKVVLPWNQVKRFSDRKTGFLLWVKPTGSRWIPKRAFEPEDLSEISNIAKDNLSRTQ